MKRFAPADPKAGFTLDELYKALDTDVVEVVRLPEPITFVDKQTGAEDSFSLAILDEEGKLKGREPNIRATEIWAATHGKLPMAMPDYFAGPVMFVTEEEFQ
jgi:hypothetical protein